MGRHFGVLALILLLAAGPSMADEGGEVEQAQARFAATVAAFPAPSAAHQFSFSGPVLSEGKARGRFTLSVKAVAATPEGGEALWRLGFSYTLDKTASYAAEAYVTHTLRPVRGEVNTTNDGEQARWRWVRNRGQTRVVHTSDSTQPRERSIAEVRPALATVAGVILFARLAPETPARYRTKCWNPSFNTLLGQQPYIDVPIRVARPPSDSETERRIEAGLGVRTLAIVLDRRMRLPVSFTLTPREGPTLHFGLGEDVPLQPPTADVFTRPAKTAKAAALRAAFAFATADAKVLDDVMHWPGLRQRMGAKVPARVSPEAFRKGMLGQLVKTIQSPQLPKAARSALLEAADGLKEEKRGGVVRVTLPKRFKTAWYEVVDVDGIFHLVGWPGI